ncbi:MAG TPA: GNAT family N-acetyltransferase [Trebonia sp.]|jgi:GNAT superfamily N-acetyltransferase
MSAPSAGTARGAPVLAPALASAEVRRAVAADRAALNAMFARCTDETRFRRFHGAVKALPERYLTDALSGMPFHYALVAYPRPVADVGTSDPGGRDGVVALASCRTVAEGAAELGLLIEDAWQRQGLGTRLLRDLVTYAAGAGLRVLEAQLLAEQAWIAGLLRPYGSCRLRSTWGGVLNVSLRLGHQFPASTDSLASRDTGKARLLVHEHRNRDRHYADASGRRPLRPNRT